MPTPNGNSDDEHVILYDETVLYRMVSFLYIQNKHDALHLVSIRRNALLKVRAIVNHQRTSKLRHVCTKSKNSRFAQVSSIRDTFTEFLWFAVAHD